MTSSPTSTSHSTLVAWMSRRAHGSAHWNSIPARATSPRTNRATCTTWRNTLFWHVTRRQGSAYVAVQLKDQRHTYGALQLALVISAIASPAMVATMSVATPTWVMGWAAPCPSFVTEPSQARVCQMRRRTWHTPHPVPPSFRAWAEGGQNSSNTKLEVRVPAGYFRVR